MGRNEPKRSSRVSRILTSTTAETSPDLAQRVSAINDVAKTVRTLLTSMAAVAIAMAATMIAATDEAIFRDSAKVFPSLSVEIRLSTAFTLAPPIFVFLHLNALLQLHLMTRRLRAFLAALDDGRHDEHSREAWLRQLHGLSFVQMLLPDRQGSIGRLLQAIASWISVVGLPVLLLLAVQVSFVRYQSWAITIIHMVSLGADMALLMWFQLSLWPDYRKRLAALALPGVILLVGMMTQAVPPDRRYDDRNVFDAHVSDIQGFAWTRRTLSLPGAVLINTDAKPDLLKPLSPHDPTLRATQAKMLRLSVPNRNFVGIDLSEAELFGINLEGSNLQHANLWKAQMREANLRHAQMQWASFLEAQMQGVELGEAQMNGADLSYAQMQGANISDVQIHGANIKYAKMWGAKLSFVKMVNVDLTGVQMQGANLFHVTLVSVNLSGAQMQGTRLALSDLSEANGRVKDCTALLSYEIFEDLPLTREEMAAQLAAAGMPDWIIALDMASHDRRPPLRCADAPDQPLWQRPHPNLSKFGEIRRRLACAEPMVTRTLWETEFYDFDPEYRVNAILARPPEADCPGLRAISADLRKEMDTFWANLSPDQKRQADRR